MNGTIVMLASIVAQEKQQGSLLSLLPMVLILGGLMYFMTVQPRKQRQRHAEFVKSLEAGTEVVTSGGIHGTITYVEDDVVHLQVDTDVVIRVSKASLARRESDPVDPKDRKGKAAAEASSDD